MGAKCGLHGLVEKRGSRLTRAIPECQGQGWMMWRRLGLGKPPRRDQGPPPGNPLAAGPGTPLGVYCVQPSQTMKSKVIILAALLSTAGAGLVLATPPAASKPTARVSVVFVEPQKFTDFKRTRGATPPPSDLMDQLRTFLQETGERYVPADQHLEIKITDIDLAGEFEPQLGPQFEDVRIVRAIYPPRIKLEFSLTDARGNVVNSGQRELTDLAFHMRTAWPPDDYLRYEKDLLRDWFSAEFRRPQKS